MTTTVALIALICIVILGSGADKNSNICPYVGAAWGHIYLLALCSRNADLKRAGQTSDMSDLAKFPATAGTGVNCKTIDDCKKMKTTYRL